METLTMTSFKTLLTAAAVSVALTPFAFADQRIITFPSPVTAQVEEILNTSGRGMGMPLDAFCEINKKKITELAYDCSLTVWIKKGQEISLQL